MKCKNCKREAEELYYTGSEQEPTLCESCYTDLCAYEQENYDAMMEQERYDNFLAER